MRRLLFVLLLLLAAVVTLEAVTVTDDFNRANGALGANWDCSMYADVPSIDSNHVIGDAGGGGACVWAANTFATTQCSQALLLTNNNAPAIAPAVRMDAAAVDWYAYYATGEIYRTDNGSTTQIATGTGYGDTVVAKICATGTTVEWFNDGVSDGTVVDSALTAGSAGFVMPPHIMGSPNELDNWEATGAIAGGGSTRHRLLRGVGR